MMKIYRKGHHINIYLGLWFVVHIFVSRIIPAGIRKIPAVLENIQWKHQSNAWDIFKVNNKETRTVSLTLFGCLFVNIEYTGFTHCSGVSIVNFEQVNTGWVVVSLGSYDQVSKYVYFTELNNTLYFI